MRDERSPRARAIGVVWLLYFLVAPVAVFLSKGLVHPNDAAATANGIVAHESAYRAAVAVDLIGNAVYIALTALIYRLFARVNLGLSTMAAFFSLAGCGVQIFGGLLRLAPLVILKNASLQHAFAPNQLQAAALLSLELYRQVFDISFVLFGLFELVLGYLIYRSMFLPRLLGIWLIGGGLGALTFLWPPLAHALWYLILALGAGEAALMLWLLVKGVDNSRWQESTGAEQLAPT